MKIIVAGSRGFTDYPLLVKAVNRIINRQVNFDASKDEIVIVSGAAKGADKLGERFANENCCKISSHPANWDKYGKAAGYIRNEEMAIEGDILIAFWDMTSSGTRHMINLANKHNKKVYVVDYKNRKILEDYK